MRNKADRPLAIFLPSFCGGGAERSMLVLARGLADREYSVDLIVNRAEGPYRSLVDPRIRVVELNASRVLLALPKLVHYLRTLRPSAILSTLDYANLVVLWAHRLSRVQMRVVVLEQNTISITSRQSRQWRQKTVPRLVRRFYPWAHRVIGNSQGVANDLARIIHSPKVRINVIYNPVVTPELREMAQIAPPHPWLAAAEAPVVLAVGRLTTQKDFPTLVRAFAEVRRKQAARLIILGEGPDRALLEGLVRDLELKCDVILPGFVANPYAYMAHAAVFVLSSRWEGLPTVLIEALACGTRVIATDCPSGPREILRAGHYGPLVPMQNVPALAEAIIAALNGRTPLPGPESWRPFELNGIVDQYTQILLEDNGNAPCSCDAVHLVDARST